MLDLTIHNIDEGLERELRDGASRNNRSIEEEAKLALRRGLGDARPRGDAGRSSEDVEARRRLIMSYGRKDPEPFDLKAFSDALSDGSE